MTKWGTPGPMGMDSLLDLVILQSIRKEILTLLIKVIVGTEI